MSKTYITWENIQQDTKILANKLSKFNFSCIIGVANGGMIPATLIAKELKVNKLLSCNLKSYQDDAPRKGPHNINDVVDQIMKLYKMSKEERKSIGKKGYDWAKSEEAGFTSEIMSNRVMDAMEELFTTWKPREKYEFLKDTDYEKRVLPHKLIY